MLTNLCKKLVTNQCQILLTAPCQILLTKSCKKVLDICNHYEIDRIKAIQPAPALKAGGQGDRYTIMINGRERYLFFEHNADYGSEKLGKWFVERRV